MAKLNPYCLLQGETKKNTYAITYDMKVMPVAEIEARRAAGEKIATPMYMPVWNSFTFEQLAILPLADSPGSRILLAEIEKLKGHLETLSEENQLLRRGGVTDLRSLQALQEENRQLRLQNMKLQGRVAHFVQHIKQWDGVPVEHRNLALRWEGEADAAKAINENPRVYVHGLPLAESPNKRRTAEQRQEIVPKGTYERENGLDEASRRNREADANIFAILTQDFVKQEQGKEEK